MTWIVLSVLLVLGVISYRRSVRSPSSSTRRRTFAWAWAFWGAVLGSFFGFAGFGAAIPGTGVGALIGFLAATAWMKVDSDEPRPPSRNVIADIQRFLRESQAESAAAAAQATAAAAQAATAAAQLAAAASAAKAASAIQAHNAPIHSKIADIDGKRNAAMSELYGAASPRQRKKAAATVLSLDTKRINLVRQLR